MKQEVLITLRGTQGAGGDDPQTMELVTKGTMTGRNGKFAISYEETELTGTPGVTATFLILNPDRVVLTREGPVKSRMVFVRGTKDEELYDLGFGSLLISVYTKEIRSALSDNGGTLFIDYLVEIEDAAVTHNVYEITVEVCGG